jgi:alpha-tubulin suppressor-like RCC1 family protein
MRRISAFGIIVFSLGLTAVLSACQNPSGSAGSSGAKNSGLITAGGNHTCTLEGGVVQCWGENKAGQLGDGTFDDRTLPVQVVVFSGSATAVAAGFQHTCALTAAGEVVCWGDNWAGQLGEGTNKATGGYKTVAAGGAHTCALTAGGGIRCWGGNKLGALGDGTNENRPKGVDVAGLNGGVQALAAGMDFTCAVSGNRAKCWGADDSGQLGNGSYKSTNGPVDVAGLGNGIVSVAAGFFHACALTAAGEVWCWGENISGELGDGTNAGSPEPVKVTGLEGGALAIVVGGSHTCALMKNGGVKCWGDNSHGQLGDGTTAGRNAPADVAGLTGGVTALAAGANHSCALTGGGAIKCWGSNGNGQLGDGTTVDRNAPVQVSPAAAG